MSKSCRTRVTGHMDWTVMLAASNQILFPKRGPEARV